MISIKRIIFSLAVVGAIVLLLLISISAEKSQIQENILSRQVHAGVITQLSGNLTSLLADFNLTGSERAIKQAEQLIDQIKLEYTSFNQDETHNLKKVEQVVSRLQLFVDQINSGKSNIDWLLVNISVQDQNLHKLIKEDNQRYFTDARAEIARLDGFVNMLRGVFVIYFIVIMLTIRSFIAKPLDSIKKALIKMGDGQLDTKISLSKLNEWNQLIDEINKMSAKLLNTLVDKSKLEYQVQKRRAAETKAISLANQDDLTQLANRRRFLMLLDQNVNFPDAFSERLTLIYISLDQFKLINDQYGHAIGDQVLIAIANKLRSILEHSPSIFRIGGDEFVIMLKDYREIKLKALVLSLKDKLLEPIEIGLLRIRCSMTIGIASSLNKEEQEGDNLLSRAISAVEYAKKDPANIQHYYFYDTELDEILRKQHLLISNLKEAIREQQLQVWFQPQIDLHTLKTSGFEALLRWQDQNGKFISPDIFVPALEQSADIIIVGELVIEAAIKMHQRLLEQGLDIPISVNVSAVQLESELFARNLSRTLRRHDVSPSALPLELTETAIFKSKTNIISSLRQLRSKGFILHLDDFGTGNASLDLLNEVSFDAIKIDKSFTQGFTENGRATALIDAIILITKRFDIDVIMEGIETKAQLKLAQNRKVGLAQGYYFSKALNSDEAFRWSQEHSKSSEDFG